WRRPCSRRSVPVSIRTEAPSHSRRTDGRRRLSRGSVEVQTLQRQVRTGTPVEVPVPRNVTRTVPLGLEPGAGKDDDEVAERLAELPAVAEHRGGGDGARRLDGVALAP